MLENEHVRQLATPQRKQAPLFGVEENGDWHVRHCELLEAHVAHGEGHN